MTDEHRRHQPQQRRTAQPSQALTRANETRLAQREQRREAIGRVAVIVRQSRGDLERLLPDHLPIGSFMSAAGAALWKSQALMDGAIADPEALLVALREAASLGHLPGTKHYWLTPRRRKVEVEIDGGGGKVSMHVESVLGIEGYEGIIERMYRSGGVLSVHADVVYASDRFVMYAGPNGRPLHEVTAEGGEFARRGARGERIGVYAYAMLPGGVPSEVVRLSVDDLAEIRAKGGGVWNTDPIPMEKKSALRRLEKYVPVSAGYRQTLAQAQAFVAATAPTQPLPGDQDPEQAPPPVPAEQAAEGGTEPADGPVTDVAYDPAEWGGDPAWESLPVTRPGEGVPEEVRRDGA